MRNSGKPLLFPRLC